MACTCDHLTGLLWASWRWYVCSLRDPEVPWIYILPSTGLSQPPPGTHAWSTGSLLRVEKSLRHVSYSRIPLWDLHLWWAFSVPYLTQPILFPVSPGSTSLQKWLECKSSHEAFPWGIQANRHWCWVLCEIHSVELMSVTNWFGSQLPSLKILSFILQVKWTTRTYLAIRHMAESNSRVKFRDIL